MRFSSGVGVHVVLKGSQSFETSFAYTALMWSLFRVGFHMSGEKVSLGTGVIAVVAHVSLSHHLRLAGNYLDYFRFVVLDI